MYYKIFSTEKCVYILLLVILFFVNCSGFRIDNLALTDISNKKNSFVHIAPSSTTNPYSERIFNVPHRSGYTSTGTNFPQLQEQQSQFTQQHKIRHRHRLMMMMKNTRNAVTTVSSPSTSHHPRSSLVLSPSSDINNISSLYLAQNSNSNSNIRKRSFLKNVDSITKRSNINSKKRSWKTKQNEDITWRAYKAEFVFHAEIVARNNSSWIFRVNKSYKRQWTGQFVLDVDLRTLQEHDQQPRKHRHQHNQKLEQSVEKQYGLHYLLFLNSSMMPTRFMSVANPKLIKQGRFNDSNIKKVCRPDFRKFFLDNLHCSYLSKTSVRVPKILIDV